MERFQAKVSQAMHSRHIIHNKTLSKNGPRRTGSTTLNDKTPHEGTFIKLLQTCD